MAAEVPVIVAGVAEVDGSLVGQMGAMELDVGWVHVVVAHLSC